VNYYRFFTSNTNILLFLVLFTFFSGFGQTYVLSLYIPSIISELGISKTMFSTLYSLATILSGVSIVFAGKLIDRISVKKFAFFVALGLAVANLSAGFSFNIFTLFISIFLLRFFGQGLSTHTSFTTAGKYFSKARGKALSFAYLGFPFSEGMLPNLVLFSIVLLGWRNSFLFTAGAIFLLMIPIAMLLLRSFSPQNIKEDFDEKSTDVMPIEDTKNNVSWSQKKIISNNLFYFIAPTPFLIGFTLTALFFFQTFLADHKGWSVEWMTFCIIFYALSSFSASILAGPLIDKFSARKIYPYAGLPMFIGLLIFCISDHQAATIFYWFFVGLTAGFNSTVSNAFYAETYGIKNLGGVRSLFSFVMIAGTASGPIAYSFLIDAGLSYTNISLFVSAMVFINFIAMFLKLRKL